LRMAGAAAGLAAGATAALVYCLHCPEMSPAFVGVWYVLGIAVMALVGALVGPKVLAW
ncbi:MAG: NrsF family protein, partial [Telluria sp.]